MSNYFTIQKDIWIEKKKWHTGVGEWKWLTASHSQVKMWNLKEEVLDFPPHNNPKKEEERDKYWIQKMRESPRKMKLWNLKEEALDFPPHNHWKKEKFWKKNWERKLKKNEETQCWTSWRSTGKTEDGNARLQISFSLSFSFSFRYEHFPRTPPCPIIFKQLGHTCCCVARMSHV